MMSIYRNAALAVIAFAFASCILTSHPCSSVYAFTTYDEDERPAVTVTDLSFLLEGSSRNPKEEENYKHAGGFSLLTPGSCCGENHYTKRSVAFIGPIAAQAILTGAGLDDPSSGGVTAPIDTVVTAGQRIHETTSRHSDCVVADFWNWYDNGRSGDTPIMGSKNSSVKNGFVETRVAMVALETNPDAHFDVDETCLPIVRGAMIVFDGRSPHNTVLRSLPTVKGAGVSLIGGFQLSTFSPVGFDFIEPDQTLSPTQTPKSMKKRPKKKKGKSSKKKTKGTKKTKK